MVETVVWSEVLDNLVAGGSISEEMLKTSGQTQSRGQAQSRAMDTLSVPTLLNWQRAATTFEWEIPASLLNSRGELFGGYYGVLADVAASLTGLTVVKNGQHLKTTDLRITYFRPAISGKIRIEGRVSNLSKSFVHVELELFNDDDKVLAKGFATFVIGE